MMSSDQSAAYAQRGLNPHRLQAIRDHAGSRILDVGCGSGAYVNHLAPEVDIHGVDHAYFESWQLNAQRFRMANVDALPYVDGEFETVTAFEVLEHVADVAQALAEIRRVASGNVILTVPNCEITPGMKASGLIYHHWIDPTHVNFWRREDFVKVVQAAGFVAESVRGINEIDIGFLVTESLGLRGAFAQLGQRVFRALQRRYEMTTLVVARKAGS